MADKPLDDKANKPDRQSAGAAPDFGQTSVGAYSPDLSAKAWEEGKQAWNASPQGRLAIRLVSRGVLGALFFTAGQTLNSKWMKGYNHEAGLLEQKNPLTVIAKLIDRFVGKPIEYSVNMVGGNGRKAVTFRPTASHSEAIHANGRRIMPTGRTLGHETVNVTFDFFCASIGDAWGRDMAAWIDPSAKKSWMKDGHVDYPAALKSALKATWRYVSYNGGEDWAVAIPYCYFMKGHRALVNHFSPGFAYDFDRTLNGGSVRMKGDQVTGNYNRAGIVDLQHRFVVYNMGTLAYRELYNMIGDKLHGRHTVLYGAPDREPAKTLGEKTSNALKWAARCVVKAGIYMTPAVPFFWIFRTPQTNYRGVHIDPEQGVLMGINPKTGQPEAVTQEYLEKADYRQQPLGGGNHAPGDVIHPANVSYARNGIYDAAAPTINSPIEHGFRADKQGVLHPIAGANTALRKAVNRPAAWVSEEKNGGFLARKTKQALGITDFRNFSNTYVNAAVAYTPYMYAKAEFANLWDDGKMDMAIERAIDGAAKFNFGEFAQGVRETGYAIFHKPLPDAAREVEAQRRIGLDKSAADVFSETKKDMRKIDRVHRHLSDSKAELTWRERMVQGKPEDRPEVGANRPKSHAEQEEMRKLLEKSTPPTPSIN
jgi:hypothetical protein